MMRYFTFKHTLAGSLLISMLLVGCREKPDPPEPMSYENGVFILNEGNFQGGNASLDFLHHDGDSVSRRVFRKAQDRPLGDVGHSMVLREGKLWVVVNNSGKIEVLNLPELDLHCLVQGLASPRLLLFLSASKAYLSDLYSGSIHILNPQTCSLTGSIPTGGWTEEMLQANGKVFVAQTGTDKVLVIDPVTDQLLDSIQVGREPNSLVQDAYGTVWVLCSGGLGETNAQLWRLNPDSQVASEAYTFSALSSSPERLRVDPSGEWLYWMQDGAVMRLEAAQAQANPQVFVAGRGGYLYGLEIEPLSGTLYVGDAKDYVREGLLYRIAPNGTLIDSFEVGVIPGSFGFD